ncbi:quinon protein alcohol dehydrogenase-like superfamily [Trichoderma compactum]
MTSVRQISGNTIGNNVTIVQGDLNTANPSPPDSNSSFLNKISKTDPFYDKKRILELKGPLLHDSLNWILDHESFKKWRHTEESSVLWIKGDPGKGKTMLLCGIVEDLERIPDENRNLGYFFCQATDSRINSASSVVAGLIFSLVKQNPTIFSPICKRHEDKLSQLDGPNAWAVLGDIFEAATQVGGVPAPICVVDALDECEHDCKLLLSLILKTSNHVKWLLSSRNVKGIERGLRTIEPARRLSLELKENAKHVSKSVGAYINNSISDIEALEDDEELQIKTVATLKRKANGTFLWVALVIEQLRDTDRRNVEAVLEELPEGLENLYDLIVQRANAKLRRKDQEACQILLSIVTTAERPLHLEELHTFISSQWTHYKSSYNILDMKDIVRDCGSLLAIRDDTIYFIHQSVKDYILGNAYNSIFPSGVQYQHRKMFETSMSAMSRILKEDIYNLKVPRWHIGSLKPPYPDPLVPIKYSCVFWVDHLIRGHDSEAFKSEECFNGDKLLQTFLQTKYLCWLEALALLRSLTPKGGSALQRLNNQAASYYKSRANGHQVTNLQQEEEAKCLMKLIGDAYRFFHSCQHFVRKWPLQLYYSAIVFDDKNSAIYEAYQQPTRAHYGDFVTVINKPQRLCSLQRNIDINARDFGTKLLYSPDSSTLCVLFNHPQRISLYRTDTAECVIRLSEDGISRYYVSFLPDSRYLISVSSIGSVQTWAVDSGSQVQRLSLNLDVSKSHPGHPSEVFREQVISLSPHGDLAASIFCTDEFPTKYFGSMKIWTTKTGACTREIDLMHTPSFKDLYIFAPNSALIALVHKSDALIYSIRTGNMVKHIRTPDSSGIRHSKFSQDSALLALVHESSKICFWCTKNWTKTYQIELGYCVYDFDLSLNASMFVAASGGILVLGSTRKGEQLLKIATGVEIENVSFSPDWSTSSLLTSANSTAVQIWRVDTRDFSTKIRSAPRIFSQSSVAISPGSKYVAARSPEGYINIWSGKSGECMQALKCRYSDERARPVFSPNLEYVACADGDQGDVRIWRLTTGEPLHLLESHSGSCSTGTMVFSEDSKYLVAGYHNGEARVWCAETGECLFKNDIKNVYCHSYPKTMALAISPESKYMARASGWPINGAFSTWGVRIWDWRAGHNLSSFGSEEHQNIDFHSCSLRFSSDATILVSILQTSRRNRDPRPRYKAEIRQVATGTLIAWVEIGESYSEPLFDPITNKILTDRAGFCKGSSWERWERVPRQAYKLWQSTLDGFPQPALSRTWICFGGERLFLVPKGYSPRYSLSNYVAMSSSLLAYTTAADEMMIIQLPSQHELQRLGIITVDSDNVGHSSLC